MLAFSVLLFRIGGGFLGGERRLMLGCFDWGYGVRVCERELLLLMLLLLLLRLLVRIVCVPLGRCMVEE